jgi:hypothetical protein
MTALFRRNPTDMEVTGMADSSDTPVLDLLAKMTIDSLEQSTLDAETIMVARIAALVALDAAPVSYLTNLEAAGEAGIDLEMLQGILIAIAPIVGTARVMSAASKVAEALGIAIAIAEADLSQTE